MAVSKKQDFLKRSVGFLETLERIVAEGFFQEFSVDMSSDFEGHFKIHIQAKGIIPDNPKDHRPGIKPFLDAAQVIEVIKTQLNERKLKLDYQNCEIETKDWPKWNKNGTDIVGKAGLEITLKLLLNCE